MVSRDDVALVFGGIVAATALFGIVKSVVSVGGGSGGNLTATVHVTDQSGAPVAGAAVTLGASLPQTTNSSGTAVFTGFPSGTYQLIVSATNFQTFTETVNLLQSSTYAAQLAPNASCIPQLCNCGYSWNPTVCSCVKQQVGAITGVPSLTFIQNWYAHINGVLFQISVLCAGTTPGGDPGCNGTCGPTTIIVKNTVSVLDVNGAPVCGAAVQAFLSAATVPWITSDGQTWGHFNVFLERDALTTDLHGNATFDIIYEIVVDGSKGPSGFCVVGCCGPSTLFSGNFPVLATFQVPGTTFKTVTSVGMSSSIFVYYYA